MSMCMPLVAIVHPGAVRGRRKPRALERQGVLVSMENLMTFPFVRNAVENETLSIHGLWNDIGEGDLYYCDGDSFTPVT